VPIDTRLAFALAAMAEAGWLGVLAWMAWRAA